MPPGLGHLAYLAVVKESVWGTKVVAGMDFLEFLNETLDETVEEKIVQGINKGRVRTKRVQGAKTIAGDINWEVNVEDVIGDIIKGILPTEVFVDDGGGNGGQHTFTPGNVPTIGLTVQVGRDTAVRDFFGGKVGALVLNAASGELLQATASMVFKNADSGSDQAVTYSTQKPLVYHTGVIQIDGVAFEISEFALTIAAGLKQDRRILGSNLIIEPQPGMYEVSGTFQIAFDDEVQINKFLNGTASKLSIDLTGPSIGTTVRRLRLVVPEAFFNGETPKVGGADEETRITIPFMAIKTGSGTPDELVELKLDNSRQSVY
ncbi:hypothetical protein LCGC14_0441290 [marine sediment metagenome]|uniref:Uncharacterized protein n=1 Tax=marine sediment metagenome TaxID=412755 RepID=A0A0F9T3I5_9ZZZZ